jgi:hypothetical protein
MGGRVPSAEDVLGEFTLRASSRQVRRLREWADGFTKREWAVESANGLGYLIDQQLVADGETVFDVPPMLASRVRVLGSGRSQKNDPNDARSIAIAALRSDRLAVVRPDDHARVSRLLVKRHRDMAGLRRATRCGFRGKRPSRCWCSCGVSGSCRIRHPRCRIRPLTS